MTQQPSAPVASSFFPPDTGIVFPSLCALLCIVGTRKPPRGFFLISEALSLALLLGLFGPVVLVFPAV